MRMGTVTVMVLLMPSCGVGNGGVVGVGEAVEVAVAVQAGLGVMLGVEVGVIVGVWLGVGVFVGVDVLVGVAVSAMVGVGTTVFSAWLSGVKVLATATAVACPSPLFNTAPTRKSSSTNNSKEPSSPLLRPLLLLSLS